MTCASSASTGSPATVTAERCPDRPVEGFAPDVPEMMVHGAFLD